MSAFILGYGHIDVIVQTAMEHADDVHVRNLLTNLDWHEPTTGSTLPTRVGRELILMNLLSVAKEYPDKWFNLIPGYPEQINDQRDPIVNTYVTQYIFNWDPQEVRPLDQTAAAIAVGCYRYQSSDRADWVGSPAERLTNTLRYLCGDVTKHDRENWPWEFGDLSEAFEERVE